MHIICKNRILHYVVSRGSVSVNNKGSVSINNNDDLIRFPSSYFSLWIYSFDINYYFSWLFLDVCVSLYIVKYFYFWHFLHQLSFQTGFQGTRCNCYFGFLIRNRGRISCRLKVQKNIYQRLNSRYLT